MRFELARMFLLPREQSDVFERRAANGGEITRQDWLRQVFSERIEFVHRKGHRRYEPDAQQLQGHNRIIARIGRESLTKENDPHDYLRDISRPQWRACLVIIDPISHSDGQKVAIEASSSIGSGFGNFQSLIASINSRVPPEPFAIELNSITDSTSFWEYVAANKGHVTSITLEVAMPNMFNGETSFEEGVKRLRDREKARIVRETIENPDGLQPDTKRMRSAVSYTSRGGGRVKAKAKNAPAYDSNQDKKILEVQIENEEKDVSKRTIAALDAFNKDAVSVDEVSERDGYE